MQSRLVLTILFMLASGSALAQDVNSENGKLSYAAGWSLGNDLKRSGDNFDVDTLTSAIRDVEMGNEPKVSLEEMQTLMIAHGEKKRAKQVEMIRKLSEENQAKSEVFLTENKAKTNIVVLPSGVQYRIIEEGSGPKPQLDSKFMLHYRGSTMDGREFDSTFSRGEPVEHSIDDENMMKGWQEVLPLMKQGSTWQVFIPPELAFGQQGMIDRQRGGYVIEPNVVLMFDLKLVEILK